MRLFPYRVDTKGRMKPTMIDPVSRVAFVLAIPSKHAKYTAKALEALINSITSIKNNQKYSLAILLDNGSKFKREFDVLIEQKGLTHYWTYFKRLDIF